jgi:hypothetical protein
LLQGWLTASGVPLALIGLIPLAELPYTLKLFLGATFRPLAARLARSPPRLAAADAAGPGANDCGDGPAETQH